MTHLFLSHKLNICNNNNYLYSCLSKINSMSPTTYTYVALEIIDIEKIIKTVKTY